MRKTIKYLATLMVSALLGVPSALASLSISPSTISEVQVDGEPQIITISTSGNTKDYTALKLSSSSSSDSGATQQWSNDYLSAEVSASSISSSTSGQVKITVRGLRETTSQQTFYLLYKKTSSGASLQNQKITVTKVSPAPLPKSAEFKGFTVSFPKGAKVIRNDSDALILSFTDAATSGQTLSCDGDMTGEVLVVGGGGGGGAGSGSTAVGAGGNGATVARESVTIEANTVVNVSVGPGGPGGDTESAGTAGTKSTFGTITAPGGAGGSYKKAENGSPGSGHGAYADITGTTTQYGEGGNQGAGQVDGDPGTPNTGNGGQGGGTGDHLGGKGGDGVVFVKITNIEKARKTGAAQTVEVLATKAISDSDSSATAWTASSADEDIVTVTASGAAGVKPQLTGVKAGGPVTVTVENATAIYTYAVTVVKMTPVKESLSVTSLYEGDTLSKSAITLTMRNANGDEVHGSAVWKNGGTTVSYSDSGKTKYDIVFTPDDTDLYDTVTIQTTVTVRQGVRYGDFVIEYSNATWEKKGTDVTFTFKKDGSLTIPEDATATADILVVGGGGGGGGCTRKNSTSSTYYAASGGAGGKVVEQPGQFQAKQQVSITVGAGGAGGAYNSNGSAENGFNGGESKVVYGSTTIKGDGGVGGAGGSSSDATDGQGAAGQSGSKIGKRSDITGDTYGAGGSKSSNSGTSTAARTNNTGNGGNGATNSKNSVGVGGDSGIVVVRITGMESTKEEIKLGRVTLEQNAFATVDAGEQAEAVVRCTSNAEDTATATAETVGGRLVITVVAKSVLGEANITVETASYRYTLTAEVVAAIPKEGYGSVSIRDNGASAYETNTAFVATKWTATVDDEATSEFVDVTLTPSESTTAVPTTILITGKKSGTVTVRVYGDGTLVREIEVHVTETDKDETVEVMASERCPSIVTKSQALRWNYQMDAASVNLVDVTVTPNADSTATIDIAAKGTQAGTAVIAIYGDGELVKTITVNVTEKIDRTAFDVYLNADTDWTNTTVKTAAYWKIEITSDSDKNQKDSEFYATASIARNDDGTAMIDIHGKAPNDYLQYSGKSKLVKYEVKYASTQNGTYTVLSTITVKIDASVKTISVAKGSSVTELGGYGTSTSDSNRSWAFGGDADFSKVSLAMKKNNGSDTPFEDKEFAKSSKYPDYTHQTKDWYCNFKAVLTGQEVGDETVRIARFYSSDDGPVPSYEYHVTVYDTKTVDVTVDAGETVTLDCTSELAGIWFASSDDATIATVTDAGARGTAFAPVVTGLKEGETTLKVWNAYRVYTVNVTVNPGTEVKSVTVAKDESVEETCSFGEPQDWTAADDGGGVASIAVSPASGTTTTATIGGLAVGDAVCEVFRSGRTGKPAYRYNVRVFENKTKSAIIEVGKASSIACTSEIAAEWTAESMHPEIATVNDFGAKDTSFNLIITGVRTGTATIIARNDYCIYEIDVVVTDEIEILPVVVQARATTNVDLDYSSARYWSAEAVSGAQRATVTVSGGKTATATATVEGLEAGDAQWTVSVKEEEANESTPAAILNIRVWEAKTAETAFVLAGSTLAYPCTSAASASWTAESSDPSVATVTAAGAASTAFTPVITGVRAGTATITVRNDYCVQTIPVTVRTAYEIVNDAFTNPESFGGVFALSTDISAEAGACLTLAEGKELTLDLAGHRLGMQGADSIRVYGKLTVVNSVPGTFYEELYAGRIVGTGNGVIRCYEGSELDVQGGLVGSFDDVTPDRTTVYGLAIFADEGAAVTVGDGAQIVQAVAENNGAYYATVNAAIAAAQAAGGSSEVSVIAATDEEIEIPEGSAVKLNGNDNIQGEVINNGTMEIALSATEVAQGSGTFTYAVSGDGKVDAVTSDKSKEVLCEKGDDTVTVTVRTSTTIMKQVAPDGTALDANTDALRTFCAENEVEAYTKANTSAEEIETALQDSGANTLPLWKDYVMGIKPTDSIDPVTVPTGDTDEDMITLSVPAIATGKPSGDYAIAYKVVDKDGKEDPDPQAPGAIKIPLKTGTYTIKAVLTPAN